MPPREMLILDRGSLLIFTCNSVVYLGATEQYTTRLADGMLITSTGFNPDVKHTEVGQEVRVSAHPRNVVVLPISDDDPV